jgi:uncharacterized protein (TIGR02284 family)
MRLLIVAAAVLGVGACAHMDSEVETLAVARAWQADPAIAAETGALNGLIRISIDATRLYEQAAEEADDVQLQRQLETIAAERKAFARELQKRVAMLGGKPAETGQVTGAIHRSFTALRGLVQNDSAAAADEVYSGETFVIGELNKVLEQSRTPPTRELIRTELVRVKAQRDDVGLMKAQIETRRKQEAASEDAEQQASRAGRPDPS